MDQVLGRYCSRRKMRKWKNGKRKKSDQTLIINNQSTVMNVNTELWYTRVIIQCCIVQQRTASISTLHDYSIREE